MCQIILKAFKKLFDNGHAVLLKYLPKETIEAIMSKTVQHFIPWRLVFKDSVSTPAIPVLDASSNTPLREDGTGGRSLNDACMKGRIADMNLLRMILRFVAGLYAISGDLSQFYNSFKLTEKQWNLQLFLFKKDLDPNNETMVGVIRTLIYGVKSVAAQTEAGVEKLADFIQSKYPDLAELLKKSRYVDDLGDSKTNMDECNSVTDKADKLFKMFGLSCKEWSYTGHAPTEKVSSDGISITIGGMLWLPELDVLMLRIPQWHFGSVSRGRIKDGTKIFEGKSQDDMEKFVPKSVTPRQIASKFLSYYDLLQLALPLTAGMKRDLRKVVKESSGLWDKECSAELRSSWVKNLWMLERLKGMKYQRAKMPEDAVDGKMRMLILVDAAKMLIVTGVWVGFKLKSGGWSCSYLIGRALLTAEDSTTPKDELNGLTCGGNMCFIVREALENWVEDYAICGDSTIALHWVKSDKLKLSLFHRNRVVQIRRTVDLDKMCHVITSENLADLPTRPDRVGIEDADPSSPWHTGLTWMKGDLSDAVANGILTPLKELSMSDELKKEFDEGLVFEKSKDILTKGHTALIQNRIDLVYSRAKFASYLILPTKFHFPSIVRIIGYVYKFIKSFKCLSGKLANKPKFNMFQANNIKQISLISAFPSKRKVNEGIYIPQCDEDLSDALSYLFKTATKEVKQFVKPEILQKQTIENEEILLSKSKYIFVKIHYSNDENDNSKNK